MTDDIQARLAAIERHIDVLYNQAGLQAPYSLQGWGAGGGLSPRVAELLARGKKIEAIKVYREETGVGLKEAKDAVERFER
ncbi:ribosomal protein L7/L12 [Occultella aeris]|uniref:50S ribosomal protein L7/L12 n=1 Tax=Occultella aeris TaxID=2761496 RepID=A0A7M4DEJ0_9MICO|nr:ribosomal protein L7/L12 [Occultella aeris]VZO35333.1 50S ribosomal protein L7/L12 [Occultella aeris]